MRKGSLFSSDGKSGNRRQNDGTVSSSSFKTPKKQSAFGKLFSRKPKETPRLSIIIPEPEEASPAPTNRYMESPVVAPLRNKPAPRTEELPPNIRNRGRDVAVSPLTPRARLQSPHAHSHEGMTGTTYVDNPIAQEVAVKHIRLREDLVKACAAMSQDQRDWGFWLKSYSEGCHNTTRPPGIPPLNSYLKWLPAPYPPDELVRLRGVKRYEHDLTPECENGLRGVLRAAAIVFKVKSVAVSLIHYESECVIMNHPIPTVDSKISRVNSLGGHAILSAEPMIIKDTSEDWRFKELPTGCGLFKNARFYAAAPIIDFDGNKVGVISIWDPRPRGDFNYAMHRKLATFSRAVQEHLELVVPDRPDGRDESFVPVVSKFTAGMVVARRTIHVNTQQVIPEEPVQTPTPRPTAARRNQEANVTSMVSQDFAYSPPTKKVSVSPDPETPVTTPPIPAPAEKPLEPLSSTDSFPEPQTTKEPGTSRSVLRKKSRDFATIQKKKSKDDGTLKGGPSAEAKSPPTELGHIAFQDKRRKSPKPKNTPTREQSPHDIGLRKPNFRGADESYMEASGSESGSSERTKRRPTIDDGYGRTREKSPHTRPENSRSRSHSRSRSRSRSKDRNYQEGISPCSEKIGTRPADIGYRPKEVARTQDEYVDFYDPNFEVEEFSMHPEGIHHLSEKAAPRPETICSASSSNYIRKRNKAREDTARHLDRIRIGKLTDINSSGVFPDLSQLPTAPGLKVGFTLQARSSELPQEFSTHETLLKSSDTISQRTKDKVPKREDLILKPRALSLSHTLFPRKSSTSLNVDMRRPSVPLVPDRISSLPPPPSLPSVFDILTAKNLDDAKMIISSVARQLDFDYLYIVRVEPTIPDVFSFRVLKTLSFKIVMVHGYRRNPPPEGAANSALNTDLHLKALLQPRGLNAVSDKENSPGRSEFYQISWLLPVQRQFVDEDCFGTSPKSAPFGPVNTCAGSEFVGDEKILCGGHVLGAFKKRNSGDQSTNAAFEKLSQVARMLGNLMFEDD